MTQNGKAIISTHAYWRTLKVSMICFISVTALGLYVGRDRAIANGPSVAYVHEYAYAYVTAGMEDPVLMENVRPVPADGVFCGQIELWCIEQPIDTHLPLGLRWRAEQSGVVFVNGVTGPWAAGNMPLGQPRFREQMATWLKERGIEPEYADLVKSMAPRTIKYNIVMLYNAVLILLYLTVVALCGNAGRAYFRTSLRQFRAESLGRCPACGYRRWGEEGRCPECGHSPSDQELVWLRRFAARNSEESQRWNGADKEEGADDSA